MKIFSSILALYLMVLFIMPCADRYDLDVQKNHSTQQDTHDHSENDLCTPFCLCGCCGMASGVALQWNVFTIENVHHFDLAKPKVYYKSVFIPRYFGEIWQPPKLTA